MSSQWEGLPVGDAFTKARGFLRSLAHGAGEWAGIPMQIDGEELVVEPSYKFAHLFPRKTHDEDAGLTLRNTFYSTRYRCDILVIEENGRVGYGISPAFHHLQYDLHTLGCSVAWGMEQETKAIELLKTLVKPHAFKQYLLTGMFIESSKRSGVAYLFRRLKPTVAIRAEGETTRILCALCGHPVAHYAKSWAGGMCPTDDVVAALMLMRADEPMLWRRFNQHAAHRPEAGL